MGAPSANNSPSALSAQAGYVLLQSRRINEHTDSYFDDKTGGQGRDGSSDGNVFRCGTSGKLLSAT